MWCAYNAYAKLIKINVSRRDTIKGTLTVTCETISNLANKYQNQKA